MNINNSNRNTSNSNDTNNANEREELPQVLPDVALKYNLMTQINYYHWHILLTSYN